MSDKDTWEDIKNGKPLSQIDDQGSDGSGIRIEQRNKVIKQKKNN